MLRDPEACPPAPLPYDELEVVGVTPHSTHRQVVEAAFGLMSGGLMTPARQAAWDELRDVGRRLAADLFLVDVDLPGDAERERYLLRDGLADPGLADVSGPLRAELRQRLRTARAHPAGGPNVPDGGRE